jgi:hypothetical protein
MKCKIPLELLIQPRVLHLWENIKERDVVGGEYRIQTSNETGQVGIVWCRNAVTRKKFSLY